jgi:hypothetical protein
MKKTERQAPTLLATISYNVKTRVMYLTGITYYTPKIKKESFHRNMERNRTFTC